MRDIDSMKTYRQRDAAGNTWLIVRNPAGWVAFRPDDPDSVLDPEPTVRDARCAVRAPAPTPSCEAAT